MEIITGLTEFYVKEISAVAIGKFDGIHIGHRRLLSEITEQKKTGRKACVFTFDPAPSVYFGISDGKELTTREEKRLIFEKLGVDVLIEFPMNRQTANMEPESFLQKILVKQMRAAFVAAGTDVSFGAGGLGDAGLLQSMGGEYGFETKLIEKVCLEGSEVSSTRVREAVEQGNMELAGRMLGEPYMVYGKVRHGNRIGRTLGMPTVNLIPPKEKLLPQNGVYYSKVMMNGVSYRGISNIGYKPTVEEAEKHLGVETYIYDFDSEIYGQEITVSLCEFRRPEMRFADVTDLKKHMQEDIIAGGNYWQSE